MHRRSAGILVASALGASSLILPPQLAPASTDDESTIPSIVNSKNQLIQLPCSACAFSVEDKPTTGDKDFDDLFWIQTGANNVLLNFTVSKDGSVLELGGKAIYAPRSQTNTLLIGEPLYVHQVPATGSEVDEDRSRKVPLEVTSVGLSTEAEVRASPEGDVIVQLQLQIIGLEGQLMHLDSVRIHLLKSGTGGLLILRLDVVPDSMFTPFPGFGPSPTSPKTDMPNEKDCKSLPTALCKLREIIEAKIGSMRQNRPGPAHHFPDFSGPPPPLMRPPINSDHLDFDARPPHHHGRPHHVRPHGSHDHYNNGTLGSFTRSVISILIPVMAGITVGLLVSLLGLLFGRIVGFFWLQICPGSNRSSRRRRSRRSRRPVTDDGKILLTEDDPEPLPVYEDAPAYEEIESRPEWTFR